MFLCVNIYSQITDLESLLAVCSTSISDLTTLNAFGWKISEPERSEDKESITDTYKFSYSDDTKNEVIERQIILYTRYNFKQVRTNFYSNDWNFLKKIKSEINADNYILKSNKPHFLFYTGERSNIGIVDAPRKDQPNLKEGYFMVSVFSKKK